MSVTIRKFLRLKSMLTVRILAMYTALQQLGFHPCHGTNMWENPRKYLTLWTEAMCAKYMDLGAPWGRRELDVALGKFDVSSFINMG